MDGEIVLGEKNYLIKNHFFRVTHACRVRFVQNTRKANLMLCFKRQNDNFLAVKGPFLPF